jgi:Prenyltransferase and squalene oxidase repeat
LPFTDRSKTLGKSADPSSEAGRKQVDETPKINMKSLLRWLVQMQGTEVELDGFEGRTNKLVDGCYSWWGGSAFALLEALGVGGSGNAVQGLGPMKEDKHEDRKGHDIDHLYYYAYFFGFFAKVTTCGFIDSLFNRKSLQKYILYATQQPAGGTTEASVRIPPFHFHSIKVLTPPRSDRGVHTTRYTASLGPQRLSATYFHRPHGVWRSRRRGWRLQVGVHCVFVHV